MEGERPREPLRSSYGIVQLNCSEDCMNSRTIIRILFLANIVLVVAPFSATASESEWFLILGRLHPMLLHLPIGMLSTLVLMEALIYFASAEYLKKAAALVLGVAAVLTFLTAVHGFLLYLTGEYTGDLVEDHLWGGITLSFTVFCFVLY